jgi:threonine synthase
MIPAGATVVLTVTGHGLKDPQWALKGPGGDEAEPIIVPVDAAAVASTLGLVG